MAIPLRVLIIEDSDSNAELSVRELELAGYKITHEMVSTGKEMETILQTQTFDLIIANHNLQQLDSFKALAILKESAMDIPFLVVSGPIGEETAAQIMKSGAHDYFLKGNLSRLGSAVERELREKEVRLISKQAGEELRQSEKRYSTIVEKGSDGVIVLQDGLLKFANDKAVEIIGLSLKEVMGKPFIDFVMPQYRELVIERYKERITGQDIQSKYEIEIINKTGSGIIVEVNASLVDYDGKPAVLSMIRDITERKKTEEDLKRSEKKYSTIVEKGNDAIIVIQDSVLVFANFKMTEMVGFSIEEILGKPFIDFVAPGNRALLQERFRKRIKGESVPDRYETALLHKNGRIILVEVSNSVIEHEGRPAALGIIRDVTEKRKLLEQLMAQDRLVSVGLLVAGVAHELNNPLTSVIGFSELLLKRELPEDAKDDLKIVNDEAKRAVLIVKNLLTFARKQPEGKIPVDVNKDILGVMALRSHEQKVNNIKINTILVPDLPQIMANSAQLQQVFFNLIVNAEQAMLQAHNKGTITIITEQVGETIKISIGDDGPGISQENMKRIFTPFFTTKEVGKGTGLGLSISHGIIKDHGGKIYAESELGKGATFIVELPTKHTKTDVDT